MKYNFDTIIDRYGTNSIKYDFAREKGKPQGLLPMWVADMDFTAPPEVLADIQQTVAHGIFGYSAPKSDYYNTVIKWFNNHFGYRVQRHEIVTLPGVVYGLAQAVRAYTLPGEAVMIQTPVYYPFYDVIRDNDRILVSNSLIYHDGEYGIDFEDFEQKIKDYGVKLFILCSPHNPVGRVWTREELGQMNDICVKYDITIVSDEIHCDFTWNGYSHTCFGLLNENAIIATAPSKTFNLAGLQVSNLIIKNEEFRKKMKAEIIRSGYSQLNTIGIVACQSAYAKGDMWLKELKVYLEDNIKTVREFLAIRLPKIKLVEPQAMYLLWLDFSQYELPQAELDRRVENAKLWLNSGTMFGAEGKGFQRINIACPKSVLIDALEKLEKEFAV
jgi:cysteine-S-conjugate beta-lyase